MTCRMICLFLASATIAVLPGITIAQVPDHPIITEVFTDPEGTNDAPVGRLVTNPHQEYIEIYLPTAASLNPSLDKDALKLTFYEVEGDSSSSGLGLVNYRFDLPTFDLDPSNGTTALPRPSSGVVVLGWVDYVGNPPTALAGTSSTRVGLVNGGITSASSYTFIAMNGGHFGGTTNFPIPVAENKIDLPAEALSGVIQNGSGVHLLVNRDAVGYLEFCDDAHPTDCANGVNPNLPGGGLVVAALLDAFAANDDDLFDVLLQPYPTSTSPAVDLQSVLGKVWQPPNPPLPGYWIYGAYSLLAAQVPENEINPPDPGIANGYARRYVDVRKTTETASADDPATDATTAYRHIRNAGPFYPTPGAVALTTSAPELAITSSTALNYRVLAQTTRTVDLLAANVGGDYPINVNVSVGTSSSPSTATFAAGSSATNVNGQSYALPTFKITGGSSGTTASATATVTATNAVGGQPAVVIPDENSPTVTATVLRPTQGLNATGQSFQATVFAAVQPIPAGASLNEFLDTWLGAHVAANLGNSVLDTRSRGTVRIDPSTNLNDGVLMQSFLKEFPLGTVLDPYINYPAPPGKLDLLQTVLQSAEVLFVPPPPATPPTSYLGSTDATGVRAIYLNTPDTRTYGGTFTPTERLYFADSAGGIGDPASELSNVTTSRTFELAIFETNVRLDDSLESGGTDDFGLIIQVGAVEPGSSVVVGEYVFLSYMGGRQGADLDSLDVPPHDNVANIIYLDLDNLHDVLGITTAELIFVVDASDDGELDIIEVFSLNPATPTSCQTPGECDDGNPCTTDDCTANVCSNTPIVCNDGNLCTTDVCINGSCTFTPVNCNDGLFCTGTESCNQTNGNCVSSGNPCAGNQVCNENTNACETPGSCTTNANCNDNNPCTVDTCVSQICSYAPYNCDDGLSCTVDTCAASGMNATCQHAPNDAACTGGTFCAAMACDPNANPNTNPTGCDFDHQCVGPDGNPCPNPATCDEPTRTCGGCGAPTVTASGSRYLSIVPPSQGSTPIALYVEGDCADNSVACVSGYVQSVCTAAVGLINGQACLSDADCKACESTGTACTTDAQCLTNFHCIGKCGGGRMVAAPVYRTAAEWQTARVTGSQIRPSKTYRVHAECNFGGGPVQSAGVEAKTWKWGDADGSGAVNVLDVATAVNAVKTLFSIVTTFEGCNVWNCDVDVGVNVLDIASFVDAVKGTAFPCPAVCP